MPRYNAYPTTNPDFDTEIWWMIEAQVPPDLCKECWDLLELGPGDETDHPSYDGEAGVIIEQNYRCVRCGAVLDQEIDG